jgi:hypothetical protein
MMRQRTKGITIKVTEAEYASLARLAAGQTVTAWVHELVLATVTPRPIDHVLVAEFLALRTILLNLHAALAAGDAPTADSVHRLIERADRDRFRKAQDRLAQTFPRSAP